MTIIDAHTHVDSLHAVDAVRFPDAAPFATGEILHVGGGQSAFH